MSTGKLTRNTIILTNLQLFLIEFRSFIAVCSKFWRIESPQPYTSNQLMFRQSFLTLPRFHVCATTCPSIRRATTRSIYNLRTSIVCRYTYISMCPYSALRLQKHLLCLLQPYQYAWGYCQTTTSPRPCMWGRCREGALWNSDKRQKRI